MTFEELQADIDDLQSDADEIRDHFQNAECCETLADFKANLAAAVRDLNSLAKRTAAKYSQAQKATQ